ncbi:MAG TPA: hypothetical protein VMU65_00210 [Candidatus Saccharimonadales bacterium]|nr:hypothetical protein [Candidatus Saccharimonadales bacterium]
MNLSERCGGNGAALEPGEDLIDRSAELALDLASDLSVRAGRHGVLQSREGIDVGLRQQIRTG